MAAQPKNYSCPTTTCSRSWNITWYGWNHPPLIIIVHLLSIATVSKWKKKSSCTDTFTHCACRATRMWSCSSLPLSASQTLFGMKTMVGGKPFCWWCWWGKHGGWERAVSVTINGSWRVMLHMSLFKRNHLSPLWVHQQKNQIKLF